MKIRKKEFEKIKEALERAGEYLLDLLYPRRCPICQKILTSRDGRVCSGCREHLPYIREPFCKKCGKPLRREEQEYCGDCERTDHLFRQGRAVFLYEKSFRRSVHRMKFQNHREYLDFYAEEMAAADELRRWKPAVILPVPMHTRKRKERGFDQSRLLAKKIGRLTGIPVDTKSLTRNRYTRPQKNLNAKERRENLRDAFFLKEGRGLKEPVLLVDDIYTTGATMDEVSRILQEDGIREIYFLVLCTGRI